MQIKQLGYTLMGMAITLAVVGLMAGAATSRFTIYYHEKTIDETRDNVNTIMDALNNFLNQNGYYPCPAPLDVANDVGGYGLPVVGCNSGSVGDFTNGVFRETGLVLRGAVPFRVLNLPQSVVKDAYDMRIEYAVSGILTNKQTYSSTGGKINVIDGSGAATILPQSGKAHFVVLSHGRDKAGAYSDEGGLNTIPCSGTTLDAENCTNNGVYKTLPLADLGTSNPSHFDDYVGVFMSPDLPIWLVDYNDTNNIWYDVSLAKNIAIGYTKDEAPKYISTAYKAITSMSLASPTIITTTTTHDFSVGDMVYISGSLKTDLNGKYYRIRSAPAVNTLTLWDMYFNNVNSTGAIAAGGTISKVYPDTNSTLIKTINTTSAASPVEVTTATSHGYSTGDKVLIYGVSGASSLNGQYYRITRVDADSFTLQDLSGNNITSTAAGTGGTVIKYATDINVSVKGEVKASGNIYTQYICDSSVNERDSSSNMSYCVRVDDIVKDFTCTAGYVSSIDSYGDTSTGLRFNCNAIPTPIEYRCPAGKVVTSVTTSGIVCGHPPATATSPQSNYNTSCESKTVNLCGTNFTITANINGTVSDLYTTAPATYIESYKCVNREWILKSSSGDCNSVCTSDTSTHTYSDFSFYNSGPKSGFTGNWDVTASNQCEDEYTLATPSLTCFPDEVKKVYELCPSNATNGYEGYIEKTMEWGCSPAQWNTVSTDNNCNVIPAVTATTNSNHCPEGLSDADADGVCETCTPLTQTRSRKIHNYAAITETRSFTCSARKWTPWILATAPTALNRKWAHTSTTTAIGPVKDKGSVNRLGDICYENSGVQRACYTPSVHGALDALPMYYQYKDCVCQ